MRIASFLPAATEMIYLLGLEDQLVGRSHECDYPSRALLKPVLVEASLVLSGLTSAEIDAAVGARLASGQSLYRVDAGKLRAAAPDLLVTQNLCQVCGPAGTEVSRVLATLPVPPRILWQSPRRYSEVLEAVRALGLATGRDVAANAWVAQAEARLRSVGAATAGLPRVRVAYLEWLEPIYGGGHWIPQMLEWAGAQDANARDGSDSVPIPWEDVIAQRPEVVFVAPCGSRLVDGVELLAHLVHPEHCAWHGAEDAYVRLD
jgi:iron complex transport system substrate-binding protein